MRLENPSEEFHLVNAKKKKIMKIKSIRQHARTQKEKDSIVHLVF